MATLTGTSGADTLTATDNDDTINGLGGNDIINGKAGKDTINAGDGADQVNGGAGDDVIDGGKGDDRIVAADGTTLSAALKGEAGNDTIKGGLGHDYIDGGADSDILDGGANNDNIDGGDGADYIIGGIGRDTIKAGDGNDHIVLIGKSGVADYSNGDLTNSGGETVSGRAVNLASVTGSRTFLDLSDVNGITQNHIERGETIDGGAGTEDSLHLYGNVNLSDAHVSNVERIYLNGELTLEITDGGNIAGTKLGDADRYGQILPTNHKQDIFGIAGANNTNPVPDIYGSDNAVLRLKYTKKKDDNTDGDSTSGSIDTFDLSDILGASATAANSKLHNIKHLIIEQGVTVQIAHVDELKNAGIQVITGGGTIEFTVAITGSSAAAAIGDFHGSNIVINPNATPNAQQILVKDSAGTRVAADLNGNNGSATPALDTNVVRALNNLDNVEIFTNSDSGGAVAAAGKIGDAIFDASGSANLQANAAAVEKLKVTHPSTLQFKAGDSTAVNNTPIDLNGDALKYDHDNDASTADISILKGIEHLIIDTGVTVYIEDVQEFADLGIKVITGGGTIQTVNNANTPTAIAAGNDAIDFFGNNIAIDVTSSTKTIVKGTGASGATAYVKANLDGAATGDVLNEDVIGAQGTLTHLTINLTKTDASNNSVFNLADGKAELQKFRDNKLTLTADSATTYRLSDLNDTFQMKGIEYLEIGDNVILQISSVEELYTAGVRAVVSTNSDKTNSGVLQITGTSESSYNQFAKLGIAINVDDDPIADRTTATDDGIIVLKHDGTQLFQANLGTTDSGPPSADTGQVEADVSQVRSNSAPNAVNDLTNTSRDANGNPVTTEGIIRVSEDSTTKFQASILTSNDTDSDGDSLTIQGSLIEKTTGLKAAFDEFFDATNGLDSTTIEANIADSVYAGAAKAYADAIKFGFGKDDDPGASGSLSQKTDKGAEDLAEDFLKANITTASTGKDQATVNAYIADIKGALNHTFDDLKSTTAGTSGKEITDAADEATKQYKALRSTANNYTIDEARLDATIFSEADDKTSATYSAIISNSIATHAAAIEDIGAKFKSGVYTKNAAIPGTPYGDEVIDALNDIGTGTSRADIETAVSNALKILATNAVAADVGELVISQGGDNNTFFDSNNEFNSSSVDNGSVSHFNGEVTFTAKNNVNGNMFVQYVVSDGKGGIDGAFAKIVINNDNDAPIAVKDILYAVEDGNLTVTKAELLRNDTDTEDNASNKELKIIDVSMKNPDHGNVVLTKDAAGNITSFVFNPMADFFGTAELQYTVQDSGGLTHTQDIDVRVRGTADDPTANPDVVNVSTLKEIYSTNANADTYEYTNGFNSLLANDSDKDGDSIFIGSIFLDTSARALGTLTINQAAQTFTFKAGAQFLQSGSQSGSVDIKYTLADTTGLTSVGTLTLNLTNVSTDLGGDLKVLSLASVGDRLKLDDVNTINGIKINGVANNDGSGNVVTSIGDINKDGKMDFAISAKDGNATKGAVYVVYGTGNKFTSDIDLSSLDGKNGFVVKGSDNNSDFGVDVAKLGDFNGDGIDDFVVGANGSDRSYIIYGKENQSISSLDLANWTVGTDGVVIKGSTTVEVGDYVTGLDINQDGYSDVVVNNNDNDEVFVVFGYDQSNRANTQKTTIDLTASSIAATDAIKIKDFNGADSLTRTTSLSSGDVNKDGKADLIIGTSKGDNFVVFSTNTSANWNADFDLTPTGAGASLSSARAVKITGAAQNAVANIGATFIGDINNNALKADGLANDKTVGDIFISTANNHAYVVYGKAQDSNGLNNDLNINLANLTAAQGFKITGSSSEANTVIRTAKTYGDFNGDGVNDILVSESTADPNGNANAGAVYVIYGTQGTTNNDGTINDSTRSEVKLADLNGKDGFRLEGVSAGDLAGGAISFVSDLNGDTLDDIIISATGAEGGGTNRGESYVVYGFNNNSEDVNLNPYVVKGLKLEGNAAATVFQTFTTTLNPSDLFKDEDVNDTLTLSITNPDGSALPSYITFNSSTNQLHITSRSSQTIELRITATDSQGAKASFVGTVQVSGNQAQLNLASLNSLIGKTFEGENAGDEFGIATSSIGDINGDGYDDFVIGANGHDAGASGTGKAYVVFGNKDGSMMGSIANIVSDTNDDGTAAGGKYGFTIKGSIANQNLGVAVSSAGDINGDGIDDLLIGASGDAGTNGKAYVIYGIDKDNNPDNLSFGSNVDLTTLGTGNNPKGFSVTGPTSGSNLGVAVSNIGDLNNDGVDDYAVSATGFDSNKGTIYVIYGQDGVNSGDVTSISDASKGFSIAGAPSNGDLLGASVSGAGDVNGDGVDDMIFSVQTGGTNNVGEAYIIYGKAGTQEGLASNALLLSKIDSDSSIGTKLVYSGTNGGAGRSVSSAGDLNGDGFADVIVSASFSAGSNGNNSGFAHVVYGSASLGSSVALASLNGDNGFKINGAAANDQFSRSVSNIGDFNGDGFDDIVVGANAANSTGRAYVIFGTDAGFAASTQLNTLNGPKGFLLAGAANGDLTGRSVSDAGDVNGDGFDDILVGANQADPGNPARSNAGKAYIVYGFDAYNTTAVTSTGTNGKDKLNGSSIADNLSGGKDDDILRGGNGNDMLKGEDGNDTIYGGRGNDYIDGGLGNDIIKAGEGNDMKLTTTTTTDANGVTTTTVTKSAGVMGGANDDKIYGEDGNDWIDGGTGNDMIWGGDGMDIVDGGDGNDTIKGGNGNDAVFNSSGAMSAAGLKGGKGADTIYGDRGNDWIDGGEDNDMLYGGAGMDRIDGGTGDDTIRGGDGNDVVFKTDANGNQVMDKAGLKGDAGNDKIYGEAGNDYLMGGDGNDMLDGGAGNDKLHGGEGKDTIDGGAGDDTIDLTETTQAEDIVKFGFGSGKDTITKFRAKTDNFDFIRVQTSGNDLVFNKFADNLVKTAVGSDLKIEFKNTAAGAVNANDYITLKDTADADITGADFIIARTLANSPSKTTFDATSSQTNLNDVRNEITGGTGEDDITGGALADILSSGGGGGTIKGGDGHDIITGGAGKDTLEGGDGNDTISASEGANDIKGGKGNDTITGGSGDDKIDGGDENDIITDAAGTNDIKGGKGNDTITGGSGDDKIDGGDENDTITDSAGTNELKGGKGNDTITGGSGVDTIEGGDNDDTLRGMAGADILKGDAGADTIFGGDGVDTITGGEGIDTIHGGKGDDKITLTETTSVEDIISFGAGDGKDEVTGFIDGKDFIRVELSSSLVVNKFADIVKSDNSNAKIQFKDAAGNTIADDQITLNGIDEADITIADFILARTLDDTGVNFDASTADLKNFRHDITGGNGNDTIKGGDKADTIDGGQGNDTLTGGAGADVFVFEKGAAAHKDTIKDFVDGTDKVTLKGFSDATTPTPDGFGFNDLTITGNGTQAVNVKFKGAGEGDWELDLEGAANITLSAADFNFIA